MDLCCATFPLSESLIQEVGKSSLYQDRNKNVNELLTEEGYNQFQLNKFLQQTTCYK